MEAPADLMGQSFVHSAKAVNVSLKKAFFQVLGVSCLAIDDVDYQCILGKFLAQTDWEVIKHNFRR